MRWVQARIRKQKIVPLLIGGVQYSVDLLNLIQKHTLSGGEQMIRRKGPDGRAFCAAISGHK